MIRAGDRGKGRRARRRSSPAASDHHEADPARCTTKERRTDGRERRGSNDDLDGLELKYDLMRLRRLRTELEEEDNCLASKEDLLSADLLDTAGPGRWRRHLSIRARLFWIGNRRRALSDRQRWFRTLEEDLRLALRLRAMRRR